MEPKKIRIVFMGTPDFAVASLKELVENGYNVVGVVTAADKPAGRGLKLQQSAVKQYALSIGIPVLQPDKLKDPEFVEQFSALNADLGIVIAFRMLPEVIWSQPALGTFNLHASLLPQYRGAAPINWAVINGEKTTGVTTFLLNSEIDKGDVLGVREVEVEETDTAGSLHDKLMETGKGLVLETVDKLASGDYFPIVQPSSDEGLKPAPKIFRETCRINWNETTNKIYNLIRGLSPYPASWSELHYNGVASQVKIYKATKEINTHNISPGRIVTDNKTYLKVAAVDGFILIEELQLQGKKRLTISEFLRGFNMPEDSFFD